MQKYHKVFSQEVSKTYWRSFFDKEFELEISFTYPFRIISRINLEVVYPSFLFTYMSLTSPVRESEPVGRTFLFNWNAVKRFKFRLRSNIFFSQVNAFNLIQNSQMNSKRNIFLNFNEFLFFLSLLLFLLLFWTFAFVKKLSSIKVCQVLHSLLENFFVLESQSHRVALEIKHFKVFKLAYLGKRVWETADIVEWNIQAEERRESLNYHFKV